MRGGRSKHQQVLCCIVSAAKFHCRTPHFAALLLLEGEKNTDRSLTVAALPFQKGRARQLLPSHSVQMKGAREGESAGHRITYGKGI